MHEPSSNARFHERWAHFRFSAIGPLLAAASSRGQLQAQLQEVAAQKWRHPVSGDWVVLGRSIIERWRYKAFRGKAGPVEAPKREIRSDHGQHPLVNTKSIELWVQQPRQHSGRSYQLHFDNLAVLVEHLEELWLRYASWDLSDVYLADLKNGAILCRIYPVDKNKNVQGQRAPRAGTATSTSLPTPSGMAPLLQKTIQRYALTRLPPAYLVQPKILQNPS